VLVEQAVNEDEQHRGRDDEVDLPPSKTLVSRTALDRSSHPSHRR
jgi:hypothetical protein